MKLNIQKINRSVCSRRLVLGVFLVASTWAFAVDGIFSSKSSGASSFSNFKKELNLSLRSGFTFQGNKTFDKSNIRKVELNGFVTLQKGNVFYHIPNKQKVILQKFKTPTAPVIR
jgi:hypothetical protein